MLTSFRGLAAPFLIVSALGTAPALAGEEADTADRTDASESEAAADLHGPVLAPIARDNVVPVTVAASAAGGDSGFELSGNVALVSDYRFRGVSFSDGDIALQGGLDLGHSSGFYAGTWASTISGGSDFGELELDLYAGWSGDVSDGVTVDLGLLYYIYPTGDAPGVDTDYFEPYASIGTTLGPASATFGVAYAWEQDSLGGGDNLYLYTDLELGIPQTPITLTAHLGYTDGVFATDLDGDSFDWGLGANYAVTSNLTFGLHYVDTQGPSIEDFTDAGFFASLTYSM